MVVSRDSHGDIVFYDQPSVISPNRIPRFCKTALRRGLTKGIQTYLGHFGSIEWSAQKLGVP